MREASSKVRIASGVDLFHPSVNSQEIVDDLEAR